MDYGIRSIRLIFLALAAVSAPASATTYFEKEVSCPIGGEIFTAHEIGSSTSWGQRPDGRAYGTLPFWPLTECPGNGFVIFDEDLSSDAVAKLEPLVASAEYQAMRSSESPFYRAWWLATQADGDDYQQAGLLLSASWDSDDLPELKARYQQAFASAAMQLNPQQGKGQHYFWLNARAANALRELGKFTESSAVIRRIDRPALLPADKDQKAGARFFLDGLLALNADRNSSSEPASLIPAALAAQRCKSADISRAEQLACNSEDVRAAMAAASGE